MSDNDDIEVDSDVSDVIILNYYCLLAVIVISLTVGLVVVSRERLWGAQRKRELGLGYFSSL